MQEPGELGIKGSCPVAPLSGDKGDWGGGVDRGRVHGLIYMIRSELDGQYSLLHSYPWNVLVFGALGCLALGFERSTNPLTPVRGEALI